MNEDTIKALPNVIRYQHTGSRAICNPPPIDTDDDWLILT